MAKPTRGPRPIISNSISDTASQAIVDGLDAGFTIDEMAPDTGTKLRGEAKFKQESLDEIVDLSSQPYPWERPPEFSNPKHALDYMVGLIFQPEAMKNIVQALATGAPVADIAMVSLYAKFTEGKFNPDVLMLLAEPIMYVIMAIGEEANIKYNIEDSNDLDEIDDEDYEEEFNQQINEFRTVFEDIKKGTMKQKVEPEKINSGVVPQNILDKVKEQGPEIRSLLSQGES